MERDGKTAEPTSLGIPGQGKAGKVISNLHLRIILFISLRVIFFFFKNEFLFLCCENSNVVLLYSSHRYGLFF